MAPATAERCEGKKNLELADERPTSSYEGPSEASGVGGRSARLGLRMSCIPRHDCNSFCRARQASPGPGV
jgi:hypothetical protein